MAKDDTSSTANSSALESAFLLQKQAAELGFDWPDVTGVLEKVQEELDEITIEIEQQTQQTLIEQEMGDLLFACVNLARHLDIDPDQALQGCIDKFKRRFNYIEQCVEASGKQLTDCSLQELDNYWEQAKQSEK